MGVQLGDRGVTAGDRIKARTAIVVDKAIDQTRLKVGKVLTRVQYRCRKVRDDHSPIEDPAETAYHRQMVMDERVSPAVSARLAELRREREAVTA